MFFMCYICNKFYKKNEKIMGGKKNINTERFVLLREKNEF